MTAPVFLAPVADLAALVPGGSVEVTGAEGRHAVSVRRLRPGEPVVLVDGAGRRVTGTVGSVEGRDRLVVVAGHVDDEPVPVPRLVVVQALPKGERADLAVELLTEVGADAVVPWAARRCVAVWRGERAERGVHRWQAVAREAAKQARRSRVPEVSGLVTTADVARLLAGADRALVLHESADRPIADVPLAGVADVVLVVGPEGGIDPDELAAFEAAGATSVRLGPSVLRTSTAGAVAVALVAALAGRW